MSVGSTGCFESHRYSQRSQAVGFLNFYDDFLQEIKITGATIFVNPFKDEMEAEAKAEEEKRKEVSPTLIAEHYRAHCFLHLDMEYFTHVHMCGA